MFLGGEEGHYSGDTENAEEAMGKKSITLRAYEKRLREAYGAEMDAIDISPFLETFNARRLAFRATARRYQRRLEHDANLGDMIRRQCAARILVNATMSNQSLRTCKAVFDEIKSLGFVDAERRVTITMIYADHLSSLRRKQEASEELRRLRTYLRRRTPRTAPEKHFFRTMLKGIEQRLAKITHQ